MSEHRTLLELSVATSSEAAAPWILRSTLDLLPVIVVITDEVARIVYVNKVGAAMLAARDPIWSHHGRLSAAAAPTAKALAAAIDAAARSKNGAYTPVTEVALPYRDGRVAMAHARPLTVDRFRLVRTHDRAVAVFITEPTRTAPHLDALSRHFELTRAETRVLEEIALGKSRKGAALALGLADSTIKTHLENIYAKTGAADRSALCRLVQELTWSDPTFGCDASR